MNELCSVCIGFLKGFSCPWGCWEWDFSGGLVRFYSNLRVRVSFWEMELGFIGL